jgi:hypothetical protein
MSNPPSSTSALTSGARSQLILKELKGTLELGSAGYLFSSPSIAKLDEEGRIRFKVSAYTAEAEMRTDVTDQDRELICSMFNLAERLKDVKLDARRVAKHC